ncbi:MAG: AAA family ATPase, partial [Nitrospinae bacterium]|nr:AAA family ATPase [Nitrospinota bacterium]
PAMRGRAVDKALRNGPLTHGQREAVKLILTDPDRVVGVQGYAGTGKTKMLRRARALLEKRGYEVRGLAPSASAARTLEAEAGIGSETLQRFLARNAGVARGRLTRGGEKKMRAAYGKTALVVDEGSLASTREMRELLRISEVLRLPRVVLVGDAKQLDAVDAGKPFAQLQAAGMKTATMNEIMRQRDQDLKAAVEATLAGDVRRAFDKLGSNVAEVKPDNLAGAAAARWLALPPEARANAGLMAPSHAIREKINAIVRERLVRDGVVRGPSFLTERLVSRGYTNPEKSLAANYSPGDVVAFHRPYKRLGVEKGDELRVAGVDHANDAVILEGKDGGEVRWEPGRLAARTGGVEVYRVEHMELRQGDKVRWTRNDPELGLMNSQAAEVLSVRDKRVTFRIEDGRILDMTSDDSQLRHVDRAWASTVHAFQGRTVDTVIAAMEANHPDLTNQKTLYVEISRARDRAELVTDDAKALRERLEAATGERIAALEATGEGKDVSIGAGKQNEATQAMERRTPVMEKNRSDRGLEL